MRRAEAYRDGINAWVDETRRDPTKLPGEFTALGVQPPTWTVRDTARIGVFLARTVPSGDGVELDNLRALREVGARAFAKLLPLRAPGRISTVPRKAGLFPSQPGRTVKQERAAYLRSRRALKSTPIPAPAEAAKASSSEAIGGSYMWGVNRRARKVRKRFVRARGADTLLFNGPQLGYSIPELFVEFELHSPVQNIRGVSAAGIPVMGIGHNGNLAWGFTSGLSDEDDLYAERLTGQRGLHVQGRTAPDELPRRALRLPLPRHRPARPHRRHPQARQPGGLEDRAHLPHRSRPGAGAGRRRRLRAPVRHLGPRAGDARGAVRAQRREDGARGRPRDAPGHLERERDRRRRPRQHRLLASRPAPAAPAQLRRAPALPRHRRGRVARPAAAAQDART